MALVALETSQAGQGIGNGLGPKTDVVKIAKTNITEAELKSILEDMQFDGFAVAGVGTADGSAFVGGTTDWTFAKLGRATDSSLGKHARWKRRVPHRVQLS